MIVYGIHALDKPLTARQHGLTHFGAAPLRAVAVCGLMKNLELRHILD